MNPLQPMPSLLAKIGSIIVHIDEFNSPSGHPFDAEAVKSLLADAEVNEWIIGMRGIGLLPVRRG